MPAASIAGYEPRLFRTYEVRANTSVNCKTWEAMRATMARPDLFDPILIGPTGQEEPFIHSLQNNLIQTFLNELQNIYHKRSQPVACLISVGAGHCGTVSWADVTELEGMRSAVDTFKLITDQSEKSADDFIRRLSSGQEYFSHLNVTQGMQEIGDHDWKKSGDVKTHTMNYLSTITVNKGINRLAIQLSLRSHVTTTQRLTMLDLEGLKGMTDFLESILI